MSDRKRGTPIEQIAIGHEVQWRCRLHDFGSCPCVQPGPWKVTLVNTEDLYVRSENPKGQTTGGNEGSFRREPAEVMREAMTLLDAIPGVVRVTITAPGSHEKS